MILILTNNRSERNQRTPLCKMYQNIFNIIILNISYEKLKLKKNIPFDINLNEKENKQIETQQTLSL